MLLGPALLLGSTAHGAPVQAGASPALRRACATGALTAYTCAQHGVRSPVAAPALAPPIAPPPTLEAAPTAASSAITPTPSPPPLRTGRRGRRSQAEDEVAVRPFQDTKRRYDLQIPAGWELRMQGGFAAFTHGDAWIQLRAADAPTARAAADGGLELLRDQYTGLQVGQDAPMQVGGRSGRKMVLSARSRAGRPSTIVIVAAPMAAGENLVIVAGGDPSEAEMIDAGVSSMMRTLRFR